MSLSIILVCVFSLIRMYKYIFIPNIIGTYESNQYILIIYESFYDTDRVQIKIAFGHICGDVPKCIFNDAM